MEIICAWMMFIQLETGSASMKVEPERSGINLRPDQGRRLQEAPQYEAAPMTKVPEREVWNRNSKTAFFSHTLFPPGDFRASQQSHINTCLRKEHYHSAT